MLGKDGKLASCFSLQEGACPSSGQKLVTVLLQVIPERGIKRRPLPHAGVYPESGIWVFASP